MRELLQANALKCKFSNHVPFAPRDAEGRMNFFCSDAAFFVVFWSLIRFRNFYSIKMKQLPFLIPCLFCFALFYSRADVTEFAEQQPLSRSDAEVIVSDRMKVRGE